ncbi:MAG: tetratricopeptide repeat protein [Spirochaetales bacterium]|nr:tetratricopeptide repeat protein [Spirochaetales bacterium]
MRQSFLVALVLFGMVSGRAQAQAGIAAELPYPESTSVYAEGENALATNFAREPVIRYRASGNRALVLDASDKAYGGADYFAELYLQVPAAGEYTLWYAGSPPASSRTDVPGYYAPVWASLDGGAPFLLTWEGSQVHASGDEPNRRWAAITTATLTQGPHILRLEIRDKRRADGRFYFELDAVAAIRTVLGASPQPRGAVGSPVAVPLAESEYERLIRANPGDRDAHAALLETAFALGDYSSAARHAQRASDLFPDSARFLKALARARLGLDDVTGGLMAWERGLALDPDNLAGWQEAAKTAAWRSDYARSIALYRTALAFFPDDPTLTVDYGLALIWSGQGDQGERVLKEAERLALAEPRRALDLAASFVVSGYPDRAAALLAAAVKAHPAQAALRYALAAALERSGDQAGADAVLSKARKDYEPGADYLDYASREEAVIKAPRAYLDTLAADAAARPDDIGLRNLRVQALFWHGRRAEAIAAFEGLLAARAYDVIAAADRASPDLADFQAELMALRLWADDARQQLPERGRRLKAAVDAAEAAAARLAKEPDREELKVEAERSAQAMDDALVAETAALRWDQALADRAAALALTLDQLRQADKPLADAFELERSASGWTLDRQVWLDDLASALKAGDPVAWFVRTRLPGPVPSRTELGLAYAALAQPDSPSLRFGALKAALALDRRQEALSLADALAPGGSEGMRLLAGVLRPASEGLPSGASAFSGAPLALAAIDALLEALPSTIKSLDVLARDALALGDARDQRLFREVERDLVSLRRELGSFHLADGRLERASAQFRTALQSDPGDAAAVFALANLRQRAGDWVEAMRLYRRVYELDPSYANVQGFHNALARSNADSLAATATGYVDPLVSVFDAGSSWSLGLASSLELTLALSGRDVRRYTARSFLVDDGMGGTVTVTEDPSSASWMDAGARLRLGLPSSPVKVAAELGATIVDRRGSAGYPVSGEGILDALSGRDVYPRADIRLVLGSDGSSLSAGASLRLMDESLVPGRPLMYRASADASVTLPFMDFSYARLYGRLDDVILEGLAEDPRLIATGLGELALGFHLDDSPWTNLLAAAELSFEHAFDHEPRLYYAPDQALNARLALTLLSWPGLSGGGVLGFIGRVAGGIYADADEFYPLVQADLRLEWTRRDATFGGRAFLTQAFPSSGDAYWTLGFELSGTVPVTDLIAP